MGYYMYTEVIWWGKLIAATPNGRHAGYYISHGVTPTRLHEIKSVTDVLKSIKAMDLEKCAANSIANVMLPSAKIDEGRMVGFIRACAKNGIEAIQVNCVSRDELLAAQKDPEHYKRTSSSASQAFPARSSCSQRNGRKRFFREIIMIKETSLKTSFQTKQF